MAGSGPEGPSGPGGPGGPDVPALCVRGLVQRYGERKALDALSFELRRGSFTALLGPNGAGKSTLFQVLAGLFAADEGEVLVDGRPLARRPHEALARIGIVFQQPALDLDLSVERIGRAHV